VVKIFAILDLEQISGDFENEHFSKVSLFWEDANKLEYSFFLLINGKYWLGRKNIAPPCNLNHLRQGI